MQRIYVVGTADTTGDEPAYLAQLIGDAGAAPWGIDAGIRVALDIEGGAFRDPAADGALVGGLASSARWSGNRQPIRLPLHINDPAFADAAVAAFREIAS